MANFEIQQLEELPPTACPCGQARRAFARDGSPASVHVVDITANAKMHYHKATTETYVVLEGQGRIELDGVIFPLKPLTAVRILPGCRHRALGTMRILNVCIPPFDPADEFED